MESEFPPFEALLEFGIGNLYDLRVDMLRKIEDIARRKEAESEEYVSNMRHLDADIAKLSNEIGMIEDAIREKETGSE